MFARHRNLVALEDRGPLRVMFVITSMPVGGAETLLVELVRRIDRKRLLPEVCCLKERGPLGDLLAEEIPVHTGLLTHKLDLRVLPRLTRLLRQRQIDAVVTIEPGDKMFWGRLAGWMAGVPVICSALHSTGVPFRVEWLNRQLTPITDAFIACAKPHGRYLVEHEGCPLGKVKVIPNGVDVERFHPRWPNEKLQRELGLAPGSPVVGIVAALRPVKHHELFLRSAARISDRIPSARFLIVGDGPQRAMLETMTRDLGLTDAVRFLGNRNDIEEVLSLLDVFMLTSHMEANPVSILEAMASEIPVVATRVGSVEETVLHGKTGYLVEPDQARDLADQTIELLENATVAETMGRAGREYVVAHWSITRMIDGYHDLLETIYRQKVDQARRRDERRQPPASTPEPSDAESPTPESPAPPSAANQT